MSPRPARSQALAIVGAGRAGSALAAALARAGWTIAAVAARRPARARALARRCGAPLATSDAAAAARAADAVILAVPDRVLPGLARALARDAGDLHDDLAGGADGAGIAAGGARGHGKGAGRARNVGRARPPIVALHTSGASGASALAPLRARGWSVGSFHPLLSFGKPAARRSAAGARRAASLFEGATIAVDGDPAARRLARRLAASLGAHPLAVPAEGRAGYHLAACFAANYVVTLVWDATRLLEEAGVPRRRTLAALLPLIRSTVANLERDGLPDALTGPVARGDDVTLARHAALLRRGDPQRRDLHRLLVERTARLAREAGRIDGAALRRIARALGR
jgi:predicted short-subunit dehydrogenase-like oxidoreductase (DUF2520 family)